MSVVYGTSLAHRMDVAIFSAKMIPSATSTAQAYYYALMSARFFLPAATLLPVERLSNDALQKPLDTLQTRTSPQDSGCDKELLPRRFLGWYRT